MPDWKCITPSHAFIRLCTCMDAHIPIHMNIHMYTHTDTHVHIMFTLHIDKQNTHTWTHTHTDKYTQSFFAKVCVWESKR